MTATTTDLAIFQDAALHIKDQFEIDNATELPERDDNFLSKLKAILAKRIEDMLAHESEHLKWVLYRIDISEKKVIEILAQQPLHEAVDSIAQLIIDRQIQKAITRKQYSAGTGDLSFDM